MQTKKMGDFISEGMAGKTVSDFSHSMPIVDSLGTLVSAEFPKVRYRDVRDFFNGRYRVEIIRPVRPYTPEELHIWCETAHAKVGKWYDVLSILGNLSNKGWEHRDMWQCAEICLDSCQAIGRLTCIPLRKAEPKTFETLTCEGPFYSIGKWYKPGRSEYLELMKEATMK